MLDFDLTISAEHSRGYAMMEGKNPMNQQNRAYVQQALQAWLNSGLIVAIITRGVDNHISAYVAKYLDVDFVTNGYEPGKVAIYAPSQVRIPEMHDII